MSELMRGAKCSTVALILWKQGTAYAALLQKDTMCWSDSAGQSGRTWIGSNMKEGPDLKCYLSMFWNAARLFTLRITPALCVLFSFHFDCVLYPSSLPLVPLLLFWRRDLGKDVALLPGQKLMIQNVWGLSWLVVLWRCRYREFLLWRQKLQGSQEKGRKSHVVMHHLADRLCSSIF